LVNGESAQGKLELLAYKSFKMYEDMYKVIDFLNKNLKDKRIMFGLTKSSTDNKMTISIYEF